MDSRIDLVRERQNQLCRSATSQLLELNHVKSVEIRDQFFNPQYALAVSCLLRTIVVQWMAQPDREIDIPDSSFIEMIPGDNIDDAFPAIMVLNSLREMTSSFKYVYLWTSVGTYQENTQEWEPLSLTVQRIPYSDQGYLMVMSIALQILIAIQLAASKEVTNLDFTSIRIRQVPESAIPIAHNDREYFLNTYGMVPVLTQFATSAYRIGTTLVGAPQLLSDDFQRFWSYLLRTVSPDFRQTLPDTVDKVDWSRFLLPSWSGRTLTCTYNTCGTYQSVVQSFEIPRKRFLVTIDSIVQRYQKLNTNPGPITRIVLRVYRQMLNDIYEKYPSMAVAPVPPEVPLLELRDFDLSPMISAADSLANKDRTVPPLNNYPNIARAIIQFRDSLRDRVYFETTNAILRAYDQPEKYLPQIEQLIKLKFQIQTQFARDQNQVEEILNSTPISLETEVIRTLYSILIHELPMRTGLKSRDTAQINDRLYLELIIASDPIDLLTRRE